MSQVEISPTKDTVNLWNYWFSKDISDSETLGKWTMYYPQNILDEKWNLMIGLCDEGVFPEVFLMQVSTGVSNQNSRVVDGILVVYCSALLDISKIANLGRTIVKHTGYTNPFRKVPYMFYKIDKDINVRLYRVPDASH